MILSFVNIINQSKSFNQNHSIMVSSYIKTQEMKYCVIKYVVFKSEGYFESKMSTSGWSSTGLNGSTMYIHKQNQSVTTYTKCDKLTFSLVIGTNKSLAKRRNKKQKKVVINPNIKDVKVTEINKIL